MNKNKFLHIARAALVLMAADCPLIGGQAVMDGVMMRNGDVYGVAVRKPDGDIMAQRLPWRTALKKKWLRTPFIRGFPILLETMINGVNALNLSARLSFGEEMGEASSSWHLALTIGLAIAVALGIFVVLPHLLSLGMLALGLGGDVEGLSFHLWDGFYKCAIFVGYIGLISLLPDIRRVFEYHGAEHKTIHAWETGREVTSGMACGMSRLHPRCGTTFLLFVICISIILQAILVPPLLSLWAPRGMLAKHIASIAFKLLLVIPISCIAYELIRYAASLDDGFWGNLLRAPGLALQKLTTREPDPAQVEVAMVALAEALGDDAAENIRTVKYSQIPLETAWREDVR